MTMIKKFLNSFLISFKVKNAYVVNQFIYSLQRLPLIGKYISSKLYGKKIFKIINVIISLIRMIIKIFGYKFLYIYIFVIFLFDIDSNSSSDLIIHVYLFLSLIGCFSNTEIFNPTRDKYYMIVLMKMDARSHTLSNFIFFLFSTWLGQGVALLLLTGLKWYDVFLLVSTMVGLKLMVIAFYLYRIKKTKKVINENKPKSWVVYFGLIIIGLFLAYGLPYFDIVISKPIFYVISGVVLVGSIIAVNYIFRFKGFAYLYKRLLKRDDIFVNEKQKGEVMQTTSNKQIVIDKGIGSDKNGFAYFHDLFVKRHRKILKDNAKWTTIVILVLAIGMAILMLLLKDVSLVVNRFILMLLPYLLFVMYFINTGKTITNAMFMNCDHSMLQYRFFRQSKTLLMLFKERLKTVIIINLVPTVVLAISLCVLLFISGGTDNIVNYVIVFMAVLAMSIFFSIHNLVIYYLLQPYNIGMEMKSTTYTIVSLLTYWGCYYISRIEVSTMIFGSIMILFAVIYAVASLFLVYHMAPKTFKLR